MASDCQGEYADGGYVESAVCFGDDLSACKDSNFKNNFVQGSMDKAS